MNIVFNYRFKYELLFVWVRGHMRPTAYSPIDQRYLYQNTNAIGIAYFFSQLHL